MTEPKGWHSRGYLPHFDSPETIQFITFRLGDSLPAAAVEAMRHREDDVHRIDRELDTGLGAYWLRNPEIASLVMLITLIGTCATKFTWRKQSTMWNGIL